MAHVNECQNIGQYDEPGQGIEYAAEQRAARSVWKRDHVMRSGQDGHGRSRTWGLLGISQTDAPSVAVILRD